MRWGHVVLFTATHEIAQLLDSAVHAFGVPSPSLGLVLTHKVGYSITGGSFTRECFSRPVTCELPLPCSYAVVFGY